jgi:hypothetical protein
VANLRSSEILSYFLLDLHSVGDSFASRLPYSDCGVLDVLIGTWSTLEKDFTIATEFVSGFFLALHCDMLFIAFHI